MPLLYAVLGAGRQGTAIAYDLGRFGGASQIFLLDKDEVLAQYSAERVNALLKSTLVQGGKVDVADFASLVSALAGVNVLVSAVPYYFNPEIAKAAISVKASMCDLGGNTDVVWEEYKFDDQAKQAGISIVPDCGLMPGMGNTLAVYAMEKLDSCQDVHIRCGGLPQNPKPPLFYKQVFSMEGLLNEYFGEAYVLRNGEIKKIPTFTELETLEFSPPVGKCEAFVTTGGTSTCPWTFHGKVKNYDYKTVRFPGHYEKIKTLLELGFFEEKPVNVEGVWISPRKVSAEVLARKINFPEDRDLVVLRVVCMGLKNGKWKEIQLDVLDFHDEKTGFSAMERTTGFPASIVAIYLASGKCEKGVVPLEKAIPAQWFVSELEKRRIPLLEKERFL
jgi:lysine 6-dehydrogenase